MAFFHYWVEHVRKLGFEHSKEMPMVHNDDGHGIYRLVFFGAHELPLRIWHDIAKNPTGQLFGD
jgi:hypothetical protein